MEFYSTIRKNLLIKIISIINNFCKLLNHKLIFDLINLIKIVPNWILFILIHNNVDFRIETSKLKLLLLIIVFSTLLQNLYFKLINYFVSKKIISLHIYIKYLSRTLSKENILFIKFNVISLLLVLLKINILKISVD